MGCEGADGVEQGASMAAREVEGDDEDEDMAGVENISMQRAEGGGGTTGGINQEREAHAGQAEGHWSSTGEGGEGGCSTTGGGRSERELS